MPLILDGTTGETFPTWTTGTRPATPNAGQTGYNTTLAILETYNGSVWCPFVTTATTFAGNGPAFFAYGSAYTSVANGTFTKLLFNTKTSPGFDTNTNYDTTNSRFTPTVAGYYQLTTTVFCAANAAAGQGAFYKNGSLYSSGPYMGMSVSYNAYFSFTTLAYANGSTDYFEVYGYQSSGSTINMGSNGSSLFFSGALVRAA